jgi:APA family basic amino acid/polyamine antiporter
MFLCAKSASAATAALGLAGYVLHLAGRGDSGMRVWLAAAVVVALTVLVASGLRRSNTMNVVVVSVTLMVLTVFAWAGAGSAAGNWQGLPRDLPSPATLLEAIALMFVAYAGYGRVATLGEEVREPRKTIPRAIVSTLALSAIIYLAVAMVSVGAVGSEAMARATEGQGAPLEMVARSFGVPGIPLLVGIGAITAMLGVIINLLLGLSRVLFAMGRRADMPNIVTRVDRKHASPYVAVAAVGVIILALTLIGSIKLAWSFSAFTVLIYYSLTNLAALRIPRSERLYPRAWAVGGLISCAGLAFWVEPRIWAVGLGLIGVGVLWHWLARFATRAT